MTKNLLTNIRRIFVDEEFIILSFIFLRNSIFVKFLDLLVGFRKFYILKKSWMKKNSSSNIRRMFVGKFFAMCRWALTMTCLLSVKSISQCAKNFSGKGFGGFEDANFSFSPLISLLCHLNEGVSLLLLPQEPLSRNPTPFQSSPY